MTYPLDSAPTRFCGGRMLPIRRSVFEGASEREEMSSTPAAWRFLYVISTSISRPPFHRLLHLRATILLERGISYRCCETFLNVCHRRPNFERRNFLFFLLRFLRSLSRCINFPIYLDWRQGGRWGNCDNFLIRMLYKVERWREDITRNSNIDEEQYPGGSAEGKGEHSPSSITGMNNIEDVVTTYYIYIPYPFCFKELKLFAILWRNLAHPMEINFPTSSNRSTLSY